MSEKKVWRNITLTWYFRDLRSEHRKFHDLIFWKQMSHIHYEA